MCAVFNSLGSASALMLLTSLLLSGAGADWVTTEQCRESKKNTLARVRHYPEDHNATILWLDYCNLDKINESDIVGLPNITEIYLDNNAISQIDLAVFRHVPKLKTLHLGDNKLRELPAFPEHSCPNLTTLYLHYNQLTTLNNVGAFSACAQLEELRLDNNEIYVIERNVFRSLTELENLKLNNNKLRLIPDKMFAKNKKLRALYLNSNRLTYLPQDFASSIKRAGVGLDRFDFYNNPWPCACLLELLADAKRAGAATDYPDDDYFINDGTRKQCKYVGAVACYPSSGRLRPSSALHGGER